MLKRISDRNLKAPVVIMHHNIFILFSPFVQVYNHDTVQLIIDASPYIYIPPPCIHCYNDFILALSNLLNIRCIFESAHLAYIFPLLKELCHKFYQNSDRRNCQQMSET